MSLERIAEATIACGSGRYLALLEESGGLRRIRVVGLGRAPGVGASGGGAAGVRGGATRGQDEVQAARVAGSPGAEAFDSAAAEALLGDSDFWASLEGGADGSAAAPTGADGSRDRARERLAELVIAIADELGSGRPDSGALAGAYALEFVVLASRLARPVRAAPRSPDEVWTIDDAIRHIDEHFSEAFSLEWFVSRCAMNVTDFSRRFKEKAGCPLFEYVNRRRIRRACSLLKSTGLPVIEIAYSVGYNSLSFFNRYFLRVTGRSPKEYRRDSAR